MELIMSKIDRTGEVFKTNRGGDCVVIKYVDAHNVTVMFLDSFKCVVRATIANLKRGEVKNPCARNICGVGYIGDGDFKSRVSGKKTKEYQAWENMFYRNYGEKSESIDIAYADCTVHEDWHNFQVFAEWYTKQIGYESGFALDKDLLFSGNREYSTKACCLLPQKINNQLILHEVVYCKSSNGFTTKLSWGKEGNGVGIHPNKKKAFIAYKTTKESYLKELADKYKKEISGKAFDALHNLEMTEKGWLTKEDSAFKFYETGEVEIPEYYQDNLHLVGVEYE